MERLGGGQEDAHFNPRSPQGGATVDRACASSSIREFQSTLPARGSDSYAETVIVCRIRISIHAPRKGERPSACRTALLTLSFQSTLPARGSDQVHICVQRRLYIFQSTLPARGSDAHALAVRVIARRNFNPRSPQGGATRGADEAIKVIRISIHAPRKGERPRSASTWSSAKLFQSTLPARGSDCCACGKSWAAHQFQSTLPARGSDVDASKERLVTVEISIHAPRKGERQCIHLMMMTTYIFQSTLPARGSDGRGLIAPPN